MVLVSTPDHIRYLVPDKIREQSNTYFGRKPRLIHRICNAYLIYLDMLVEVMFSQFPPTLKGCKFLGGGGTVLEKVENIAHQYLIGTKC